MILAAQRKATAPAVGSVVVFEAQVGDEVGAHDVAKGVLELHGLDEEIVLGIEALAGLRRLEVEAQPLLYADGLERWRALGEIEEQDQVERDGRGEDGIAAEEIDLDLHRIAEPSEDVDVVPALFVVAARRVVVDADLVEDVLVEVGIELGLEDVFERAELRLFLGLERLGIVEHFAVAVAEDVGGVPAGDAEQARLEGRREHGLHEGLTGLEVLAADGRRVLLRELDHGRHVDGEIRRAVGERNALCQRRVGVDLRGRDAGIVGLKAFLEGFDGLMNGGRLEEDFSRAAPDHDDAIDCLSECLDVGAHLVGEVALVLALLDVRAVEALDVVLVEDRGQRLDGFEVGLELLK